MSKRKTKSRRSKPSRQESREPAESRTADAATVAWTVSVTTVFLCDVAAAVAHLYSQANPQLRGVYLMSQLLLFAAAAIGFISLLLLPVVLRLRRESPPGGFLAFAACSAVAPLLAVLVQAMQR